MCPRLFKTLNSLQSNLHTLTAIHTQTQTHTHLWITSEKKGTEADNITKQDNRHNYRAAWRQSRTLMKVQFPLPQVSTQCDCICETITLSQSKEAAFKWSVKALTGANNHSSLSHCVTEVLNPPFVLHITCDSIDCLVLHFRHLDRPRFQRGAGTPRACELRVDIQQLAFPNHLFFSLSFSRWDLHQVGFVVLVSVPILLSYMLRDAFEAVILGAVAC